MGRYIVRWKEIEGLSGKAVVVDAEDRWDAVTQAIDRLKLDRSVSMSFWFVCIPLGTQVRPSHSRPFCMCSAV